MTDPKYLRPGVNFALAHFVEECGEALAAAGKTQRWGLHNYDPTEHAILVEGRPETNLEWLRREMNGLKDAIRRVEAALYKVGE